MGADACRFFFLQRSADAQMEFDIDLAKRQSAENPVYYVQYAHARIAAILGEAQERGFDPQEGDVALLQHPAELALIADHPISRALDLDVQDAMNDPDVFGFAWLMLVRTRFIDERLERAVRGGATQLVILGAGFDTRAHRFAELLKDVAVIEIDYDATQDYKKRRIDEALGGAPANVIYASIDFTRSLKTKARQTLRIFQ